MAGRGLRRPVYVTADPWPGIPVRRGNRRNKAADLADGTWPNLTGKLKPHDYRHSHATWLDAANLSKVIQMDRRGHALQGMDRVYMHVTRQMRERLCEVLEELWQDALAERYKIAKHSHGSRPREWCMRCLPVVTVSSGRACRRDVRRPPRDPSKCSSLRRRRTKWP